MSVIKNEEFGGERPLFAAHDLILENVTFHAGESALKASKNITCVNCRFEGKYPFWHADHFVIEDSFFTEGARAALWYSRDVVMRNTMVEAPKMFREMDGISLDNVKIPNAQETLWHCKNASLKGVELANADYLFMHGENIKIEDYKHNGNYSFQYCKTMTIRNAEIHSKDAFWNTEDVYVYDSVLSGEYLGWYSKNLHLIRCKISGTQPLCYCENLVMEDCEIAPDGDLAFEDSTLNATVNSVITSVKNPKSGVIRAQGYGEIILDENIKAPADCKIETF